MALTVGALIVLIADLLLPADQKRGLGALSVIVVLAVLGMSFVVDVSGASFGGSFVTDELALFLKRTFLAAGALALLGSIDAVDEQFPARQGEYYLLLLFSLLGMTLLSGARELVLLIVCFELMSLPLVVLAAFGKTGDEAPEAGLKLYLVAAVSTAITLFGLSLLYGATGTTAIEGLADGAGGVASPIFILGLLTVLGGMGFKLGVVPFHMWVPDTYQGAPTTFVAFLSVAPKIAGFAALIRIFLEGLSNFAAYWAPAALFICVLSLVLGNLFAIRQENTKRLLAYSGVAHVGLMLAGLAMGTEQGLAMLLFYMVAYLFTNMGAFLVQSVVERSSGTQEIAAYNGLGRRAPGLAMAMLLFLLSLAGIPFVAGFWAKLYLFIAAWKAGLGWLVFLGAVMAVLALFYYLRIARAMYMNPSDEHAVVPEIGLPTRMAIMVATAGIVLMGVFPNAILAPAIVAAAQLLGQ